MPDIIIARGWMVFSLKIVVRLGHTGIVVELKPSFKVLMDGSQQSEKQEVQRSLWEVPIASLGSRSTILPLLMTQSLQLLP